MNWDIIITTETWVTEEQGIDATDIIEMLVWEEEMSCLV